MTPDEDRKDRLKLRAVDAADLATIAAVLQDAVVPMADMAYLPGERRFVLVTNRFLWEGLGADDATGATSRATSRAASGTYERINCGVAFEDVDAVRSRGLDLGDRQRILALLTIEVAEGAIRLIFAGDAEILLTVAALDCRIEDIGEPWPTRWRPDHDTSVTPR